VNKHRSALGVVLPFVAATACSESDTLPEPTLTFPEKDRDAEAVRLVSGPD